MMGEEKVEGRRVGVRDPFENHKKNGLMSDRSAPTKFSMLFCGVQDRPDLRVRESQDKKPRPK